MEKRWTESVIESLHMTGSDIGQTVACVSQELVEAM